jgi:hypothetical protein
MRHDGADREEPRGDPDPDFSGLAVMGDDGPGHVLPPDDELRQ